jgi:UDP-3-O-[3-hydroxymyristoyl] glucosamine N-acyltransferase
MADSRFYARAGAKTLGALAQHVGATLASEDDGTFLVEDVAPLDRAGATDLGFLDNRKFVEAFKISKAGACIVRPSVQSLAPHGMRLILTDDPYRAYARIAQLFYPFPVAHAHQHPRAIIDPTAVIGAECNIGAGAVIEAGAEIGSGCIIGANSVIGAGVVLGDGCRIGALCSISHAILGRGVVTHRGVHIGQDGFGFALGRGGHIPVPQLGRVLIEDAVEIGSGTCIDRGANSDTIIGAGTKIDNLVQIGHNVRIGKGCVIVSQVGIAGSSVLEDGCVLGGQVGVAGHIHIGAGAQIAAQGGVTSDLEGGKAYGGCPAVPIKDWHRQSVTLARLIHPKRTSTTN